jgi:hypothetical protein
MNIVPIAKIKSEKNILGADWCGRKLSAAGKTSQVRKKLSAIGQTSEWLELHTSWLSARRKY